MRKSLSEADLCAEGPRVAPTRYARASVTTDDPTTVLASWLARSRKAVIFTGAGISTESGIPDFRSPGGLWSRYRPIEFSDFVSSADARREAWRRRFATSTVVDGAKPNRGHQAVAQLVAQERVRHVITQNIDGLHQVSGVPEERIIELHGNATYARCLSCEKRYELAEIRLRFEVDEEPPICMDCNGLVKTATISFGQAMPVQEMARAEAATLDCDLFIAVGSSLVVYPAAGFPALAKENGARLVILNREATPLDPVADRVIRAEIGETLSATVQKVTAS